MVVNAASVSGIPDADASFSIKPDVVCLIMTADCLPVLFCDRQGKTVAAAHAGWRGLAGGVLEKTVEKMRRHTSSDIMAWLGPAIGPGTFEVGEDVRNAFVQKHSSMETAFVSRKNIPGKYLADIYTLAKTILNELDIIDVSGGGFCTLTDKKRFYSYRRDGVTGRMATGIWMSD